MAKGFTCPSCRNQTLFKMEGGLHKCSHCGKTFIRVKHQDYDEWIEYEEEKK